LPITYDPAANIITVTGFTEEAPCTFDDLYDADKAGTLELLPSETYFEGVTRKSLTTQVRPADSKALKLNILITASNDIDANLLIVGKNLAGESISEFITLYPVGTKVTTYYYSSVDTDGLSISVSAGKSVTFSITQSRWGVVWRTEAGNKKQYYFDDVRVHFGDDVTPTYFKDTNVQVTFHSTLTRWNKNFYLHKNLTFQLGEVYDETNKRGTDGCQIYAYNPNDNLTALCGWLGDSTTIVKLYGCHFGGGRFVEFKGNAVIWDCTFQTNWLNVDTPDINNVTLIETFLEQATGGIISDIFIFGANYGYHKRWAATFSIVDLKIRNCTYIAYLEGFDGTLSLIDADSDTWAIKWRADPPYESYGSVDRKYTMNLKVLDKDGNPVEGATVTLCDKDGTQIFSTTTDINGEIPEQTVLYARYKQDHPSVGTIATIYSPHKLEVKKAGYQDYQITFTLDNKIDWKIKLAKAVSVFLSFGRPVVNLKKTDPENKNVMVL